MSEPLFLVLGPVPEELSPVPLFATPSYFTFSGRVADDGTVDGRVDGRAVFDLSDPWVALAFGRRKISDLMLEPEDIGADENLCIVVYDRPTADVAFADGTLVESLGINVALVTAVSGAGVRAVIPFRNAWKIGPGLREAPVPPEARVEVWVAWMGADFSPAGVGYPVQAVSLGDVVSPVHLALVVVPLAMIEPIAVTRGVIGITAASRYTASARTLRAHVGRKPVTPRGTLALTPRWPELRLPSKGIGETVTIFDGGIPTVADSPFLELSEAGVQLNYWTGYDQIGPVMVSTATQDLAGHAAMVGALIAGSRPAAWTKLLPDPTGVAPEAKLRFVSIGRSAAVEAPFPLTVPRFDQAMSGPDALPRLVMDEVVGSAGDHLKGVGVVCLPFERAVLRNRAGYDGTCAALDWILGGKTLAVTPAGNAAQVSDPTDDVRAPGATKNTLTVGGYVASAGHNRPAREVAKVAGDEWGHSRHGGPRLLPGQEAVGAKPDVAGPAGNVLTYRSTNQLVWDSGDLAGAAADQYAFHEGTSVACALVAGAAANLRGHVTKAFSRQPSAAALKALLIHGAASKASVPARSARLGWGKVDLRSSLADHDDQAPYVLDGHVCQSTPLDVALRVGAGRNSVNGDGLHVILATLVWRDPPSRCLGGGWVAQYILEIGVQENGAPWHVLGSSTVSGAHVVHALVPAGGGAGPLRLRVTPVTKEATDRDQPFALVLSGADPGEQADVIWLRP